MCLAKKRGKRGDVFVSVIQSLRLQILGRMPRKVGNWFVMITKSAGKNGGTVEPPCDFQTSYRNFPLFKGTPAYFSSRDARPRAPPQVRKGLFLACR